MCQPLWLPPLPYQQRSQSPLSLPLLYQQMGQPTPPPFPEATSDVRGPTELEYLKWVKVHPSHPVASVGSLPSTLGNLKQCHCNCSSSQRKAQHHLIEERLALRGDSSSASPGSSPELAHQEEEDPGAQPKVPPLGFKEIAKSLTRGESPEMEIDCPLTGAMTRPVSGICSSHSNLHSNVPRPNTWALFTCPQWQPPWDSWTWKPPQWQLAAGGWP